MQILKYKRKGLEKKNEPEGKAIQSMKDLMTEQQAAERALQEK
eukprot:UN15059